MLDIPAKSQKRGDQQRVATVLKVLGWTQEKTKKVRDGKRVRLYVRDGKPAEPLAMSPPETSAATALTDTGWSEVVLPDGRRVLTQPEPDPFDDDGGAEIIDLMDFG